jgi:nitrogen fixation protein FixH
MSNTNDSPPQAAAMKPARHLFWPIFLVSLISIHILSVVVMVIIATHDKSFAIEPDWYQKGLHYEQTAQQQEANRQLAWSVRLAVGKSLAGSNQRSVTCKVLDRAGKPVENATVDLVAFAHLRASKPASTVLLPRAAGEYIATMSFDDPGMWEFRLVVQRGKETFTHIVKDEIQQPSADE